MAGSNETVIRAASLPVLLCHGSGKAHFRCFSNLGSEIQSCLLMLWSDIEGILHRAVHLAIISFWTFKSYLINTGEPIIICSSFTHPCIFQGMIWWLINMENDLLKSYIQLDFET